MANILYAWEFGAALGHIGTFLPVALNLRERGHTVRWAVTQPDQAARLLADHEFAWLPAPAQSERQHPQPPLNYSDILLRYAYADAQDLLGVVVAWRELMKLAAIDVVLADHAPSAILAARTLNIPVMHFGGGFFTPPPCAPLPPLRPWHSPPATQLQAIDARLLAVVNPLLARFGKAPLARVADLFDVAETALLTFPELDHYPERGPAHYWGALPAAAAAPPVWPAADGPRLYAYLRPQTPHLDACLRALAEGPYAALVYAPGLPDAYKAQWQSDHLHFAPAPLDLRQTAREASAAITYAAAATSIAFLLAGKPVLMLPGHVEQFLFGRRVVELGAGLMLAPEQSALELPALLARVVHDPAQRRSAGAFAEKYAQFDQTQVARNIVRRCEELAAALAKENRP